MLTHHLEVSVSTSTEYIIAISKTEQDYINEYWPKSISINMADDSAETIIKFLNKNDDEDETLSTGLLLKPAIDYYFGDLEVGVYKIVVAPKTTGTCKFTINFVRYLKRSALPLTINNARD